MFVYKFMTHNQALMWSRFERMFWISMALLAIVAVEIIGVMVSGTPTTWIGSSLAAIVAQILVLKCWADMIIMSRPFENCWAFKE